MSECRKFSELLSAYIDDELDVVDSSSVDAHIAECSACRDELSALRQTAGLLSSMPTLALGRDFSEGIDFSNECGFLKPLISSQIDGELEESDRQEVENHLSVCASCSSEARGIESATVSLMSLERLEIGRDIAEEIFAKIHSESKSEDDSSPVLELQSQGASDRISQQSPDSTSVSRVVAFRRPSRPSRPILLAVAAALALLALAVPQMMNSGDQSKPPVTASRQPSKSDFNNSGGSHSSDAPKVAEGVSDESSRSSLDVNKGEQSKDAIASGPELPPSASNKTELFPRESVEKIAKLPPSGGNTVSGVKSATNGDVRPVASVPSPTSSIDFTELNETEGMVAYSESFEDSNLFGEMGISTNDDGLYAIKL